MQNDTLYLFGGDRPWDASLWTASDDRVRGGSSVSHLTVDSPESARFHGHLDTKTLGGAGFASQRTVGELALDLSAYRGIVLSLGAPSSSSSSGLTFTLTLKDQIPGHRGDGRDQAGVSWETDFQVPREGGRVEVPWDGFRATYRGRDLEDPKPLDLKDVKRVSLMARSFFGSQDGDFELVVYAIEASALAHGEGYDCDDDDEYDHDLQKPTPVNAPKGEAASPSWWRRLLCGLV